MRIAYITAGAAGMYCGSCLHDNTLAAALIRKGHDVALIPTYTPIRTDEQDVSIDRVFYGVAWGYGNLLYGDVVDFIHLDLWHGVVAERIPFFGGRYLAVFPIGNVADLAIIGGVATIIIFQRRFHNALPGELEENEEATPPVGPERTEATLESSEVV